MTKRPGTAGAAVALVVLGLWASEARAFDVIAHRGASAHAPENTLAAFQAAIAQGAEHLELDVQLSRDGEVVVFHDRDLREKTGVSGAVGDHPWSVLRGLDLAPWFHRAHPTAPPARGATTLARLDEVLARFGAAPRYHVELKGSSPALPERAIGVVRGHALLERVRITSFQLEQLLRARGAQAGLSLCWLLPRTSKMPVDLDPSERHAWRREQIGRARDHSIAQVGIPALELDRALVRYANDRGVDVRAWRVADLTALAAARDAGASGATVDWPGRALEWLATSGDAPR